MKKDSFINHFLVCGLRGELPQSAEVLCFILKLFSRTSFRVEFLFLWGLSRFFMFFSVCSVLLLLFFSRPFMYQLATSEATHFCCELTLHEHEQYPQNHLFSEPHKQTFFFRNSIKIRVGDLTNQVQIHSCYFYYISSHSGVGNSEEVPTKSLGQQLKHKCVSKMYIYSLFFPVKSSKICLQDGLCSIIYLMYYKYNCIL